ncbi:MAG TPA: hypothetical protein VIL99_07255 [Ignavibacteria bacterium]
MNYRGLVTYLTSLLLLIIIVYLTSCDSKTGITDPVPDPLPNPYGTGNGNVTFYRTNQIAGPVTIKISNKTLTDTLVWQTIPECDTNIAVSQILKAGSYSARIQGQSYLCDYVVNVEEKKCKLIDYTNCNGGNPYGEGNGKITFYRTQQIAGPVTIKISDKTLNDTLVWQSAPDCNSNIAASVILRAGDYSVRIEGSVFLCDYNTRVEEKICKVLNYTNCNNGYVGCYTMTGTWIRTADGPCPNCQGLKIQFLNGVGEVIFTPPGCRFPLGDVKWIDFNINNCTMLDLARDQFGGSPQYQSSSINFLNKDSLLINGPSGLISYSRISYSEKRIIIKKNNTGSRSISIPYTSGLQSGQ